MKKWMVTDSVLVKSPTVTNVLELAEGLEWLEQQGILVRGRSPRQFWEEWKAADELVYVVRFQVLKRLAPLGAYLPGA